MTTETGFAMDLRTAELFFRFCHRFKIEDGPRRMAVLGRLAKKKKARYLRDISTITAGKKVLRITRKRGDNEN